jgi:hypothetical protein
MGTFRHPFGFSEDDNPTDHLVCHELVNCHMYALFSLV